MLCTDGGQRRCPTDDANSRRALPKPPLRNLRDTPKGTPITVGARAMKLMTGNSNLPLAKAVADYLEIPLTDALVRRFADEEIFVEINENVRGEDVFVLQSTSYPANDNLMELLICIDALRRASAKRITAVVPYFGYARQVRDVRRRLSRRCARQATFRRPRRVGSAPSREPAREAFRRPRVLARVSALCVSGWRARTGRSRPQPIP